MSNMTAHRLQNPDNIMLYRLIENVNRGFTAQHYGLFNDILDLATSHYSEVRVLGQSLLDRCLRYFAYSYHVVLPRLIKYLK